MIIHAHFERLGIVQFESDGILLFQHLISVSAPASRFRQFSGQCIMGGKSASSLNPRSMVKALWRVYRAISQVQSARFMNEDLLHPIAWLQALRQAGQHLVVKLVLLRLQQREGVEQFPKLHSGDWFLPSPTWLLLSTKNKTRT